MTSTFNQLFAMDDTYLYTTRVSSVAGNSVNYIARWDGGADTVEAVGGGIDNGFAVAVITGPAPNSIYLAGTFTSVGGGTAANRIAYYNGSTWSNLGGAPVFTTTVNQMAYDSDNNLLYAASPSSTEANRISVYNGSTWTGIVTGFTISTSHYCKFALDSDNNLYVGFSNDLYRWNRVEETWTAISTSVGSIIRDVQYDAGTNRVYFVTATNSANNVRYYDIDSDSLNIHSTYPGYPYAMAISSSGDIFISGAGTAGYVADVAQYNGSGYTAIFNLRETSGVLDLFIDAGNTIYTWPNSSGFGIANPPYTDSSDWDEWDSSSTAIISGPVGGGGGGDAGGDPFVTPILGPSILLPKDWETVNLYYDAASGYQLLGICGFLTEKQMNQLHTMDFFYHTERPVSHLDEHIWQAPYFVRFEVYYQGRKQLTVDGITGEVWVSPEGRPDRTSDLRQWDLIKICHLDTPQERGLFSVTQRRHFPKRQYRAYCLRLGEDKVILTIDPHWDDVNHTRLLLGNRKRHCPRPNKTGELIRHNSANCLSRLTVEPK